MNYDYQYLLQHIKNLANKEHVISSSRAKSTEELSNGSLSLIVDTVRKYFSFKTAGLSDPVYLDPIGQQLINIKYINGVDVTRLISGITKGDGIVITDKGNGLYEIAIEDNKYALIRDVEEKFEQLKINITDNYATIAKVEEIDEKFNNYTTTEDLEANYATINKVNEIDNKFANYTTTEDLHDNYLDKSFINVVNEKLKEYSTNVYVNDVFATKTEFNEETSRIDNKFINYTTIFG